MYPNPMGAVRAFEMDSFIHDGFLKIEAAFPERLAEQCRSILWADTGCDPDDPSSWTKPVIWLWDYAQPPFVEAANTPVLHHSFDSLVGPGRWKPRTSIGTFPVRFPTTRDTGDTGWHVDASLPPLGVAPEDATDFSKWRVNVGRTGGRC